MPTGSKAQDEGTTDMTRTPRNTRRGFTLLELLVVMALIMVLASLALVFSPRMAEDQRSVRAADMTAGWLLVAKHRAVRDQQARGVRLVPSQDMLNNSGNTWVKEMVYIERPVDYRGGTLTTTIPAGVTVPAPWNLPQYKGSAVFITGKDLTNGGPPNQPIVGDVANYQMRDYLVLDKLEPIPYNTHLIYQETYYPAAGGTLLLLANSAGTLPSVFNSGVPFNGLASTEFRFVRSARPMAGEPVLQLPRDMIVDLNPNIAPSGPAPGGGPSFLSALSNPPPFPVDAYDIMFNPGGQVIGSNALNGKIILRVRNSSRPSTDGDQLYVVVYTASGLIATHPVNMTVNGGTGTLLSPYSFLLDGNSSGF